MRVLLCILSVNLLLLFQPIQSAALDSTISALPRLVKFSGTLKHGEGGHSGSVGVIFAIYDKEGSVSPLWLETQSVTADETVHYSVLLGSTKSEGLPASIFSSGEARWIGVQVDGQGGQPRTRL